MKLTRRSWTSTSHFLVLISSIVGVLTVVEAQKNGEYTNGNQGADNKTQHDQVQAQAPPSPPHRIYHPIYEAREFLSEHNKVRKQLGEPLLVWDKTLAHFARRFAGKRAVDCNMIHSQGPYGENIYWGSDYNRHTATNAVRAWAGETSDYDAKTNTCSPSKLCGHYKQIVWKTSTKLGCARAKCNNGGVYIICSYDPPGNYVGESPFDTPVVVVQGPPPPQSSSQTPPTPVTTQPITTAAQTTLTPPDAQTTPTPPSPPS